MGNFLAPDAFLEKEVETDRELLQLSIQEDEADTYGIEWQSEYGEDLFLVFSRSLDDDGKPVSDFEIVKVSNSFDEVIELDRLTTLVLEQYVFEEGL